MYMWETLFHEQTKLPLKESLAQSLVQKFADKAMGEQLLREVGLQEEQIQLHLRNWRANHAAAAYVQAKRSREINRAAISSCASWTAAKELSQEEGAPRLCCSELHDGLCLVKNAGPRLAALQQFRARTSTMTRGLGSGFDSCCFAFLSDAGHELWAMMIGNRMRPAGRAMSFPGCRQRAHIFRQQVEVQGVASLAATAEPGESPMLVMWTSSKLASVLTAAGDLAQWKIAILNTEPVSLSKLRVRSLAADPASLTAIVKPDAAASASSSSSASAAAPAAAPDWDFDLASDAAVTLPANGLWASMAMALGAEAQSDEAPSVPAVPPPLPAPADDDENDEVDGLDHWFQPDEDAAQ
mmetsp:Transcript_74419/g.155133  ORF Transcript_74419/g.155133 Transcript_74419/m.155133 type:complete len:355 (-) Transcript_74419:459-1523(-)